MITGVLLVFVGLALVVITITVFFVPYMFFDWFTYRLWIIHALVGLGMAFALAGWLLGGSWIPAIVALVMGTGWFVLTGIENHLPGSKRLAVGVGDHLPPVRLTDVAGEEVTHEDIARAAPALFVLYRGWWCPTSRMQMTDLLDAYDELHGAGLTIFAASVDDEDQAAPLQAQVGDRITILCGLDADTLDAIGSHDTRGRPWFLRPFVGGQDETTAMPTSLVVGADGRILVAHRANRVDDRPVPARWLRSPEFPGARAAR